MAEILINDFKAGWLPCDDPISGRKNGLLKMDNMELDSNGALSLQGGTSVLVGPYPGGTPHTLYSKLINGQKHNYAAISGGAVYRDSDVIATGGDNLNAGFGTAFNFTLIGSGAVRIKDSGSGIPINLGISPPAAAPRIQYAQTQVPKITIGALGDVVIPVMDSNFPSDNVLVIDPTQTDPSVVVIQSYPTDKIDTTIFPGGGVQTDNDYIVLNGGLTYGPFGADRPKALQFDILLNPGDAAGNQVSDYFTYLIPELRNVGTLTNTGHIDFSIKILRSLFTRVGSGPQGWESVYGFRITYQGYNLFNNEDLIISGSTTPSNGYIYFMGGSNTQDGAYEYAQMDVNNTGSYLAKSILGPASAIVNAEKGQIQITPNTAVDPQCNEVWIFRSGGSLDQWYRVAKITSNYNQPFFDTLSDSDAETLDITVNLNLISVKDIPDKIFDIVGPINGRWYYFTTNFMYPSDVNNPDLVDASEAVRICGSSSELFMWARIVNASTVLVGTSLDIYQLSGTFETLPDNSIDIYYLPLGVKYPPITCDVDTYGGSAFYLASDGWRTFSGSGQAAFVGNQNNTLVSPNLDRLYRGETCSDYEPPSIQQLPRSFRMPVVIAKNKLWCFVYTATQSRIEVYDFIRQYWRPSNYGLGPVSAATKTQDGQVIASYSNDSKLRTIDLQISKLIDGVTKQAPMIQTMVFDGDIPRQRKDSSTIKIKLTNSDAVPVGLTIESGTQTGTLLGYTSVNTIPSDFAFDLSSPTCQGYPTTLVNIAKTYQVTIGIVNVSNLIVNNISITFDPRPEQRSFIRVQAQNYGTGARKRLYTLPFQIDTLGNDVAFTPIVDGVSKTALTVNSNGKRTFNYNFPNGASDILIGTDYEYTLQCTSGLFEFFGFQMQPKQIEAFPEPIKWFTIPVTNFGKPQRKRVRNWPFVLNTLGHDVTFTPIVDGSVGTAVTINCADKKTYQYSAPADLVGVDWSGTFSSSNQFELWEVSPTEDVEVFPPLEMVHVIPVTNFGSSARKRIRMWPFVIDCHSSPVTFTPIVDGIAGIPVIFTTTLKQTVYAFETSDVIGVDFSGTFLSTSTPQVAFELWE